MRLCQRKAGCMTSNDKKPMTEKFESIKAALIEKLPKVRSVQDLVTMLQAVLEKLGHKPAAGREPKPKPAPKKDVVYEMLIKERRRQSRQFKFSEDRAPRDSW